MQLELTQAESDFAGNSNNVSLDDDNDRQNPGFDFSFYGPGNMSRRPGLLSAEQVEKLVQLKYDTSLPLCKILVAETSLCSFDLDMALREDVEIYKS